MTLGFVVFFLFFLLQRILSFTIYLSFLFSFVIFSVLKSKERKRNKKYIALLFLFFITGFQMRNLYLTIQFKVFNGMLKETIQKETTFDTC